MDLASSASLNSAAIHSPSSWADFSLSGQDSTIFCPVNSIHAPWA